jgi:hypothetical protein
MQEGGEDEEGLLFPQLPGQATRYLYLRNCLDFDLNGLSQKPPRQDLRTWEISGRLCSDQRSVPRRRLLDHESDKAMHTARLGTAAACNPSSPALVDLPQSRSVPRDAGTFAGAQPVWDRSHHSIHSPHCAVSKGRTTPQSLANPIVPPDEERGQGYAEKQTMFPDHRGQG